MQSVVINVKEIISSDLAVTSVSGEALYKKIMLNLKEKVDTYIDFAGISLLTTAFLNSAIGQLYKDYSREDLNKALHVLNLSDNDLKIFSMVTKRARDYFSNRDSSSDLYKGLLDE